MLSVITPIAFAPHEPAVFPQNNEYQSSWNGRQLSVLRGCLRLSSYEMPYQLLPLPELGLYEYQQITALGEPEAMDCTNAGGTNSTLNGESGEHLEVRPEGVLDETMEAAVMGPEPERLKKAPKRETRTLAQVQADHGRAKLIAAWKEYVGKSGVCQEQSHLPWTLAKEDDDILDPTLGDKLRVPVMYEGTSQQFDNVSLPNASNQSAIPYSRPDRKVDYEKARKRRDADPYLQQVKWARIQRAREEDALLERERASLSRFRHHMSLQNPDVLDSRYGLPPNRVGS